MDATISGGGPGRVGSAYRRQLRGGTATCVAAVLLAPAPICLADPSFSWVAVASSPTNEALDWDINVSRGAAEVNALQRCALLQRADDCLIVASGPNCVAVAWDVDEPLNRPHGAVADTPAAALGVAIASAGAFANDPEVRCSYLIQQPPAADPPMAVPESPIV